MKHEAPFQNCKNRNRIFFFPEELLFSVSAKEVCVLCKIHPCTRLLNWKRIPSWHIHLTAPLWKSGHKILAVYFKLLILSADQKMLSYPSDIEIVSISWWVKEETILNNEKSALAQRYVRKLVKSNYTFF